MNYRHALLLCIIALQYFSLHSAIIYVDKNASGAADGTSWADAFTDLQEAIDSADVGDRIWVAAAVYYPTRDKFGNPNPADPRDLLFDLKDGVKMYGGFTGSETMLGERDPVLNTTILSGDIGIPDDSTDNCYIVVLGENLTEGSVFDGFRVRKANATGSEFNLFSGTYTEAGAMRIWNSRLIIRNTRFSRNTEGEGSGLHSLNSQLRIVRCAFFNNTGTSVYRSDNMSTDTIFNSLFSFNEAPAIDADDTYIFNCTFYANLYGVLIKGTTRLYNSILTESTLQDVRVDSESSPVYDVQNCILSGGIQNLSIYQNVTVAPARLADPEAFDFAPLGCSPAVNNGNLSLAVFPNMSDFLSQPRTFGSSIDIGAIELQSNSTPLNEMVIYVDSSATGANDGTSWADAYTSLVDATAQANALAGCDRAQIRVAEGTYYVSNTDDPADFLAFDAQVEIFGGFPAGGGPIGSRDWETQRSVISGDIGTPGDPSDNSHQLLQFTALDSTCQLNGFHFEDVTLGDDDVAIEISDCFFFAVKNIRCTGVQAAASDFTRVIGIEESSLAFENITLTNLNGSSMYPVYAEDPNGFFDVPYGLQQFTFENCRFDSNVCKAVFQLNHEIAIFIDCSFSENRADIIDQRFGSAYNASASFFNCTLYDNGCNKCFDIDTLLFDHCLIANQLSTPSSNELIVVDDLLTLRGTTIFDHSEILVEILGLADVVLQNSILSGLYQVEYFDKFNPLSNYTIENSMTRFQYEGQVNWIQGPPRYRDIANRNFTLRDCSAGKNMANASLYDIPALDIYGNPRQVGVLDIGAAENQTAPVTPTTQVNVYVDSSATGTGNGTSWIDANPSLRDAIFKVSLNEQCFEVDTMFVARGTYYPDSTYGARPLTLIEDLVLVGGYPTGGGARDPAENPVVISGDIGIPGDFSDNPMTLFQTIGQSGESLVDGFIFTGSDNDETVFFEDGVVNTYESKTRFANCQWTNNGTADNILNLVVMSCASPSFESCLFSGNQLISGMTSADVSDTLKLNNCVFENNTVGLNCIRRTTSDPVVLNTCRFSQNTMEAGSVLDIGRGLVSGCQFIDNTVLDAELGLVTGIIGPLTVEHSFFVGNTTNGSGGALNFENGEFVILNSLFANNTATNGGALYFAKTTPTAPSSAEVINCTFDQNAAGAGANIFLEDSSIDIYNTILWGNGPTLSWSGTPNIDFDHNVYSAASLPPASGTVGANNLFAVDPLFLAPTDIDGPDDILGTLDDGLQVQKTSPVFNAGNNTFANDIIERDLAERVRLFYANVDIGAYELACDDTARNLYFSTDPGDTPNGTSWQFAAEDIVNTLTNFIAEGCIVDSIKLDQGTYPVSIDDNRHDVISLPSGSTLIGGYNVVNNTEVERNPELYPSVISGDLGSAQADDDNAFRLITFADYLDTTRVVGLRLVDAVDSVGSAIYAPSLPGNAPVFVDDVFIGNHTSPAAVVNDARIFFRNALFQDNNTGTGQIRGVVNRGDLLMEGVIIDIGEQSIGPEDQGIINRENGTLQIRGEVSVGNAQDP